MNKEYSTKIDITAIAKDYIDYFYDSCFEDFLIADYALADMIDVFPELEDDIREETMRLITIEYCKKKVAEKETKEAKGEPKKLKENSEYSPFSLLGIL